MQRRRVTAHTEEETDKKEERLTQLNGSNCWKISEINDDEVMWRSDMFRAEITFWQGNFWLHISSFVLPVPLIPSSWLDLCFCCCSSASYLLVCLHLKWFLLIREEIKREVNHFMHGMCGRINTRKNSRTSESLLVVFFQFCLISFFLHCSVSRQ